MRNIIGQVAVAAAALLASVQAQAEIRWGWSFDQPSLGVVDANQQLFPTVTIFNSHTSTETLKIGTFYVQHAQVNGISEDRYTVSFEDTDAVSGNFWSLLTGLQTTGLAPGQSVTLEAFTLSPKGGALIPGKYSIEMSIDGPGVAAVHNQLRWQVAAVPEPATYAMLLGGLGMIAGVARRQARKARSSRG